MKESLPDKEPVKTFQIFRWGKWNDASEKAYERAINNNTDGRILVDGKVIETTESIPARESEQEQFRDENAFKKGYESGYNQAIKELQAEVETYKEERKEMIEALQTCTKENDKYSYIVARAALKNLKI